MRVYTSRSKKVKNFKRFSLKMLPCEAKHFLLVQLHDKLTIFSLQKTHMHTNLDHVASSHFVLTHSLRVQLLAIGSKAGTRFVHVKVRDTCSCNYPQVVTLSPLLSHSSYVPNGDVFGAFLSSDKSVAVLDTVAMSAIDSVTSNFLGYCWISVEVFSITSYPSP